MPIAWEPVEAEPETIDSLAKSGLIGIAAARIGIGIATFGFPRQALKGLGFDEPDGADIALSRLAGGRDIALGLHALRTLGERERMREVTALGALVDLGDAVAFGAALARAGTTRRIGVRNFPLAASATLAGAYIYRRLRE